MARLREALVDGLLLAVPLIVLGVIVANTVAAIRKVFAPVAKWLPDASVFGVALVDLIAVAVFALLLIALGAFANSGVGRRLTERLEGLILNKIPGYLFFKSMAIGFSQGERDAAMQPALVKFDDNTVLGFVVNQDRHDSELLTVFVPSAPTPAAGTVFLLPPSRIQILDVPTRQAMNTVARLGVGLSDLLPAHGKKPASR